MSEVEHVLSVQNKLGEGSLWSVQEQVLYWVDIDDHCFFRFHPATGVFERRDVGVAIGVLALLKSLPGGYETPSVMLEYSEVKKPHIPQLF